MNLESKYVFFSIVAFMCVVMLSSCTPEPPRLDLSDHVLIPHPVEITASHSSFLFTDETTISPSEDALMNQAVNLSKSLGGLEVSGEAEEAGIILKLTPKDTILGTEGYRLIIDREKVEISAVNPAGVFYGIQTLLQLIPAGMTKDIAIPTGEILDYPRYAYRGAMLDVSRHFFGKDDVKRYIDFLADYKLNALHLHLSDDQGWRIEIQSKPELTVVGSTSEVGTGSGGFYTQDDFKEMVEYAADRFITIIPEIDMPGHTQAALVSYPELNCDGLPRELYRGTEVGFSTLCTDKEETYEFVDSVIKELAAITPGEFIHIGGDESHATQKDDYIYFINRVQEIVSKYNKTMIGWDEIAQAQIEGGTIVQQWNSAGNAVLAAEKGNRIILSPAKLAYLDMKYDSTTRLGLAWASYIEVDQAYNWDPDTINSTIDPKLIYGIEAPLWTETVEQMDDIEYLVFPRLPGYAEIGWSPQSVRSWATYRKRLAGHTSRLKEQEIDFYRSPLVDWGGQNSLGSE
ncbi:MAG: beta-N-acetylhexosaminidase [Reichenbachiella sp.]|uniref:beta-N-acetylhexosaminidase n=1 Tax=Reichenbachiella sp. TaxID=2184521 RepID=UPI00326301AF